jgi:hypothetical protein
LWAVAQHGLAPQAAQAVAVGPKERSPGQGNGQYNQEDRSGDASHNSL